MPSIDGLITGIDTNSVIEGLLSIQKNRIDQFKARQAGIVEQQTAFSGIEGRLLGLRSAIGRLSNFATSAMRSKTAVTSDEAIATAVASDQAVNGVYTFRVQNLAKASQVASQSFASLDSEISQGTLNIQVGSGAGTEITIDGNNNSVQGLVDAINSSDAGVSASIITDNANGNTAYRILLTSKESGAQNNIAITNNLGAASTGIVKPEFNTDDPVQTGEDARITLGSGAGAIDIFSSTNQVNNLIPGVTLNLLAADTNKDVTLNIATNTENAVTAVSDFVTAYNDVMGFIKEQNAYNAETGVASPLQGDRTVISIQSELQFTMSAVIGKVNTSMNRLGSIGITVNAGGSLQLNTTRLQDVLAGRVPNVTPTDVNRLFSLSGESSRTGVRFVVGGSRTLEGSVGVNVTQAATQATLAGTSDLAGSINITSANNEFTLKIDGVESDTLKIQEGTYTPDQLATQVQSLIKQDDNLKTRSVAVAVVNNRLSITSQAYGTASKVEVTGGTALTTLGISSGSSAVGRDVQGNFIVNGKEEIAKGNGQVLVGDSKNATTADLQVRVSLTDSQLDANNPEATIEVTRGLASRLDKVLGQILDPTKGRAKTMRDRFEQTNADIQESIDKLNERFATAQQSLLKQFAALESAVNDIQSTSSFLSSQLSSVRGLSGLR